MFVCFTASAAGAMAATYILTLTGCCLPRCRGASGFVQLAQDTETGEMVAIKCAAMNCKFCA